MKLCLYCGTFNPIHNAHIAVANYVKSHFDFDLILFIPAYIPPHKNIDKILANHRLNMVKNSVENIFGFSVSDIEFQSEQNSYTFNTVKKLYEMYDIDGKINFIIGTDAFKKIETWYQAEDLKNLVEFIVFTRENDFDIHSLDYLKTKGYKFKSTKMPFIDISSTELRNKIKSGQ
ncbi:nicotinate (nicotinamide) nucleotide adenylyltransferase, partial [bacterium]|nr:nicotinate (nicotinamide) nucleotide adenylyltransferase [bacterium]